MKLRLIFVSLLFLSTAYSQDSISVLFIGNSYTYYNNLPILIEGIANSFGDELYHDSQTPGGTTFAGHAANAATYTKIKSQPWDFVVLQAQSQEPSFSDSQVDTETLPYAEQLADSVYANRFCSEVMFFMTWGRENGDPQWAPISTFEGMNDRLRMAYMRFADSVQGSVSAVGSAWRYVRDNYPSIDLYSADGSHPSLEGSYLSACTFYASLYRKSPVGSSFISTVDPVTAGVLQDVAALTVLDSLDQWNLRPITEHTQADFSFNVDWTLVDFTNQSTKAESYFWGIGDGSTSTEESPSHDYLIDGSFDVQLIAQSSCDADTIIYQVVSQINGLGDLTSRYVLKTLPGNEFEVVFDHEISEFELWNCTGHKLQVSGNSATTIHLNLSNYEKGLYFLKVLFPQGSTTIRLHR